MHYAHYGIGFILALGASAQSSSKSAASASSSRSGDSPSGSGASSNSIGTPSNSAALPTLSGVSSCVTNCLAMAASADGCESVAAVDCFCPHPQNYTTALLACLATCPPATCLTPAAGASAAPVGCPSEVPSAEALVERFCAAAATPTSVSFASFTPTSAVSSKSASGSAGGSVSGSASATAPPSSSAATTSNAAARVIGKAGLGVPLVPLALAGAGVLAGALTVL